MLFTDKHRDILQAICNTFIPSIPIATHQHELQEFWERKASDLKVAEAILSVMENMPAEVQAEFKQVFALLAIFSKLLIVDSFSLGLPHVNPGKTYLVI
jgi:hypothetical protein